MNLGITARIFKRIENDDIALTLSHMDRRDTQHELWLSMQAAYNKYRYASDLLKDTASRMPIPISSADETPRMARLMVAQREEFESYIEARLQYSEFEREPDTFRTEDSTTDQRDHQADSARVMRARFRGPLVAVGGIAVISVIALSFALITREIKSRNSMPAPLSQGRDDLRSVAGKLQGTEAPPTSMRRDIMNPRPSQATRKLTRKEQPSRFRPYSNNGFTLTPSRKFKRVGPVSISLRGVDSRRQILDLLVKQEGSKPAKMRIRLKKPIWVTAAGGSRIELVATQIQRNSVYGFLNESKNYKFDTSSNRRPESSGQAPLELQRPTLVVGCGCPETSSRFGWAAFASGSYIC